METETENGTVELNVDNGVGTIEFFHPKSNSLPGEILKGIADTITDAGSNDDIRIIILKSKGEKAFCAGASFDELVSIENFEDGKEFFMFARVINAARKCPKFILGRIQGKAVGGGVGMAAATDYCLATENASIKLSELALGIGPFVVGPAVERKIGKTCFTSMTMNPTSWYSAQWAFDNGLFTEVHPNISSLDDAVCEMYEKLVKFSPQAMKEMKKVFWEGTENWDELLEERAALSGELVLSDYTKKTIEKIKQG
ncbi:MAG: enoyl-CoA hydratase/isomerase family protein [Flavobacteriales bacterium]